MGKKKHLSEEALKARLREVTADLRRLRTELQEGLRGHRPDQPDQRPSSAEDKPRLPSRRR